MPAPNEPLPTTDPLNTHPKFPKRILAALALCLAVAAAGAAPAEKRQRPPPPVSEPTVVKYGEYRDPFEPVNRVIFAFNDSVARYAVIPLAKGYIKVVPKPARRGVGNFFANLRSPILAVNHLLQGEGRKAGTSIARFGINSTVGIGGIFDPAGEKWKLTVDDTGFGETLAHYGAGYGIYLVIPFAGASDIRDASGLFADRLLSPIRYVTDEPETTFIHFLDTFQENASRADTYLKLHDEAEDPYLFFRNLHLQGVQRDADYPTAR